MTRKEHKKYRWKVYAQKKQQYENNPYDEPHKKDDHTCDALRYILMTRPDLAAESESFDEKITRIAGQSGDQFNYAQAAGLVDVADPNDLRYSGAQAGWSEGNSIPSGYSEWEYDEHMGGII